jgi:hypothetical protein
MLSVAAPFMQGDNTTLPSCGLRLSSMGKSKGYVLGRTGSGTYVSTDLPEAVVGAARRRNRMRLRRTPAAPTSARAFAELAPSRAPLRLPGLLVWASPLQSERPLVSEREPVTLLSGILQ